MPKLSGNQNAAISGGYLIDQYCDNKGGTIYVNDDDVAYSCTLNMTELKSNKNRS